MLRLNDQFLNSLTESDGSLRVEPSGYQLIPNHEIDGLTVDLHLNPWLEPTITVSGSLQANLLKGGICLAGGPRRSFREGGLHEKGLIMGIDDNNGDRKYLIADSDEEGVSVSFWDPNANTPNPQDGSLGGQYGDYSPVSKVDAEVIKEMAGGIINAARIAVESQLISS